MFGTGACLALIYWWKVEMPLVLMGVAVGSVTGWLSEKIAKKYEPWVIQKLEDAGRIERPNPPREVINLSAPTVRLSPPTQRVE